jgi:hypothetical protein
MWRREPQNEYPEGPYLAKKFTVFVIASEAKQSSQSLQENAGLLRRERSSQ